MINRFYCIAHLQGGQLLAINSIAIFKLIIYSASLSFDKQYPLIVIKYFWTFSFVNKMICTL